MLVFVLWRKHIDGSGEDPFIKVNEVCDNLVQAKRSRLASRILEFCINRQPRACRDLIYRTMLVNLANCYKMLKDDARCQKILANIDWSASSDKFQIYVASLRGEVDKVVQLMSSVAASKAISAAEFREWPVLDWVRDEPKVNDTFEQVYGEPMRSAIPEAATNAKPESNKETEAEIAGLSPVPDDVTRH